jgi:L-lactate dehydrogenase complex protein LldE
VPCSIPIRKRKKAQTSAFLRTVAGNTLTQYDTPRQSVRDPGGLRDVTRMSQPGAPAGENKVAPSYRPGDNVALFVPCYIDQLYPKVGQAVVALLERLGVVLDYPEAQTCCGQPAFNSGYWEEARSVVRHFARTYSPYHWIVVPSGSCASMARAFFGQLDSDPSVIAVGQRVYELAELLVNVLGVSDTGARFPHRITYHDSCHARRELHVLDAPRRLIRSVRDVQFVELPRGEECCGFGGTFSVKMAGTSLAMGRDKVRSIVETGAEVVVSGDMSCLMHLGGMLRHDPATRHIRTMHLAELLTAGVV